MIERAISIEDLIADSEIEGVTFFELSARRLTPAGPSDEEEEISPTYGLKTASRDDGRGFRIQIRTDITVSIGEIVAELSMDYTLRTLEATQIPRALMEEFINGVSVMSLFPYIRQAIADVTLRVFGAALTMPIMQRGELFFSLRTSDRVDAVTESN